MLDGAHALVHGAADRLRRIGMRRHVSAERFGLFDRRRNLGRRELPAVERIVGAGDAA
jgi:hypothetical protein